MSSKFYVFGIGIAINFGGMLRGFGFVILSLFGVATRADLPSTLRVFNETFISEHVEIIQEPGPQPFIATALIVKNQKFILLEGDYSTVDEDVLSLVLCHELGHALGEYPRRPPPFESENPDDSLYGSEGAADYFATSVCLKKLWGDDPHRSINAALKFLNVAPWPQVSLNAPDQNIVERTNSDSYPSRQCRLDTLKAGALGEPRPTCWFKEQ